ncbi:MAG: clostripain-related cysteine peptidase, partial [Methanocorpusculum sp.]|nr:clostripain-related cysteine peptidase [Methanocorpusculum sp.]
MIPENQQRIRTASAVLVLLLVAACIFPAAAAGTDSGTAKNYLIIYIVGADLESEHGEMSVLMQNMTSSWNPDAGEMLIIYGGSQKPGWDTGITITNASLLARDLSAHNGNVSEDAAVLERISADISTPDGLRESLAFAETYQHRMNLADANTYLIFLDHGGGASGYGMNTVTGTMLSLPDMADGLSGRTYDMIVMHACLMGTVETLNTLDDHADYLIAAEQIVDCGAVNYTKLGRTLSENPAISPRELGVEIIETARDNHVSTYALIESAKVPGVVDALNTFGAALEDALSSANSIPAVTDAYHETQLFGVSSGADTPVSIDLWQFADIISANTWEGDLHTAAGEVMAAVDAAVIAATDDGQYSSAKGISVTSFPSLYLSTLPGQEVLHESVSLGNDGWYRFYTAYVSTAPKTKVTPASDAEEDTSGITETTAGYLYTVNGSDIVIGERPLEKIYNESDDGIWKMVPTGKYYPCDWDGKWFVLNNGGEDVLISMKYTGTIYENGNLRETYSIEGNLTRVVNGVEDPHPSMITVLLDPVTWRVL